MSDYKDRFALFVDMLEEEQSEKFPDSLINVIPRLASLRPVFFNRNP